MNLGGWEAAIAPTRLLGALTAAVALLVALPASQAGAALACGDTISVDKRLKKDLLNCPADGLRFAAPDIKLDLNGHKITGSGAASSVGIEGSYDGIRVVGPGTVKGFDTQIALESSVGSGVRKVRASGGDVGISVYGSSDVAVKRVNVRGYRATGISVVNDSNSIRVLQSKVTGPADSNLVNTAVNVVGGEDNTIAGNTLTGTPESSNGIVVRLSAIGTSIEENSIEAFDNYGAHIYEMAADTSLTDNVLRGNQTGIRTSDVAGAPTGTSIARNVASGNTLDGIQLNADGSSVRRNIANNNGAWGINSPGMSIDLGGNKAKGNGQPAQCLGIVCG